MRNQNVSSVKGAKSGRRWLATLCLTGYPASIRFERSPNLGTATVRVRPPKGQTEAWLKAYCAADEERYQEMLTDLVSDLSTEDAVFAFEDGEDPFELGLGEELLQIALRYLDGPGGFDGDSDKTPITIKNGLSFRVPVSDQLLSTLRVPTGAASVTGPLTVPVSKEATAAKIAAQRQRILEAKKKAIAEQPTAQPTGEQPSEVVTEQPSEVKTEEPTSEQPGEHTSRRRRKSE
jgi:hypothetical protein